MRTFIFIAALSVLVYTVECAATNTSTTSQPVTTEPQPPTTTLTPAEQCTYANESCDKCVGIGNVQCVWCESSKTCTEKKSLIPTKECSLSDAKWATCSVNYETLIIACASVGGVFLLGMFFCICYCCCCRKSNTTKYAKEDAKYDRKRSDLKSKQDERRADRKAKNDEIRRKYGLVKEDNPYTRFDN